MGELLKYGGSGMTRLASTVVCSSLARGVCSTAVEGRPYSKNGDPGNYRASPFLVLLEGVLRF